VAAKKVAKKAALDATDEAYVPDLDDPRFR
jgi:hypothetical protein